MTTLAYNHIYLSKAARAVGNMLHDAVLKFGYDGSDFLRLLIQSNIAEQIENGNPKYVAGKSGAELFAEVIERTTGKQIDSPVIETISYDELLGLYDMLHETDIQKSYEVLDAHFDPSESKLKLVRKRCGITQEELSELSGVSLNTIRAYERKAKDINKAQVILLCNLPEP